MTTTLVLGIGNILLKDEGAGVHVIHYLRRRHLPGVTCLDGGTLSFTLANAIAESDHLIVVDAAELAAEPGTVRTFLNAEMDRLLGTGRRSAHAVSLKDLLDIARLTGSLPLPRALVGIQPQAVGWGEQLSQVVALAIPQAAQQVLALIRCWRQVT
jgi:hydrogenase maturation protease